MAQTTEALLAIGQRTNSPSYAPAPVVFSHGKGALIYDSEGNEYLDFVAGIAVNALGHAHPRIVQTLRRQAGRLLHVSNLFYTAEQIRLMEQLTSSSFADRVFLCNSGAEANEAALKLARRYHYQRGDTERVEFVTMLKSFHGRTYGAITATGQEKYHKGFGPMLPGFHYATYNDLDSVAALVNERTAAVLLEPIQGEGGVKPADEAFLQGVRQLCDERGALLIFDEVQCGIGRSGDLFAYQGYGVTPDIISLAKGLGGGVPIGAMMAGAEVFEGGWQPGSHATTFGGNPLVSAVASTVLDVIAEQDLCGNAARQGERLRAGLSALREAHGIFLDVRGRGLMVGAEVGEDAGKLAAMCREEGLLINTAGGNTLRFVPPLIITDAQVDDALDRVERAMLRLVAQRAANADD